MTKDIANIFKASLMVHKNSGLISNLEGLVRTLEYKPIGEEKTRKIAFPVDCTEPENCNECDDLIKCVPERRKKCLVYFEGNNSREIASLEKATRYEANLSLICWYNLFFFQSSTFLQTRLISLMSEVIRKTNVNADGSLPISFVNPEITLVSDSDAGIFSKYTYNEQKSNFLGCNYSTFKIDFKVKFTLYEDKNCINGIVGVANVDCIGNV